MPGLSDRQSAGRAKACEGVMPLAATLRLFAAAGCAKQNGHPPRRVIASSSIESPRRTGYSIATSSPTSAR